MPEISEVARIVHFLRTYLKNRKITSVQFQDDPIVYGKVGTSGAEFAAALKGKTVLDARQQGKYFWLVMSSPPHPLMHFGMSGWLKFSHDEGESTYRPGRKQNDAKTEKKGEKEESWLASADSAAEWPPKYWKFLLQMEGEPRVEAAFVDPRRLGRIRLINVAADEIRNTTPLKENGPDPVIDKDVLTEKWLNAKLHSKRVPVKALLLDQANISGVGNWVADEVLYHARIHPEQYSNTLNDGQIVQLHKSLMYICDTACELLGDSDKFPKEWLMKHRWSKGKKAENVLPNGHKIVHLTVGGRTSAVVPSVQKKTGPVAGEVDAEDSEDSPVATKGKSGKTKQALATSNKETVPKRKIEEIDTKTENGIEKPAKPSKQAKSSRKVKAEAPEPEPEPEQKSASRRASARLSRVKK